MELLKYLDCVVVNDDCNTPAIWRNLKKSRVTWGRLQNVITQEAVPPKVTGMFYPGIVAS